MRSKSPKRSTDDWFKGAAVAIVATVLLLAGARTLLSDSTPGQLNASVGAPQLAAHGGSPEIQPRSAPPGNPQVGDILTITSGQWSGTPTGFTYLWQDCDTGGANCATAAGTPTNTQRYQIVTGDIGHTIRAVVTAAYSGHPSASVASAPTGVVVASTLLACDLNATTANLSTQLTAATPGQVVCLASGNYTSFAGVSKTSPGITITAQPGAAVTFNSGITLNLSTVQNFTLDGTAAGGTMTLGGELDMETSGDVLLNKALNLNFQNLNFVAGADIELVGPENSNITFNRDTFVAGNAACSGGNAVGITYQIRTAYTTATDTTPSGITVENSVFVAPGDLWNPDRAIQTAAPMAAINNVFVGYLDHVEPSSCNHIDTLQLFSGTPGTYGSVIFTGNLCYDDYGCFMAFDGTSSNTITDNACFSMETGCVNLFADTGSVVNHNTQQTGGADPSGCGSLPSIQACTYGPLLVNGTKSGDRATTGETHTNNASGAGPVVDSGSLSTNTHNLWSGASSPNINGTATFAGGTNPITWAGFQLTTGSAGHAAGSDGLDVGIRATATGPPTGSGTTPVNTVPPAVTGTATHGQTLTTTNGTWTITGNIPTTTTYMWFDCSTSTFSLSGCTPIQPQTAPTSANGPTYTLQVSDETDYVFSYVTVTNANGQINAVSNATGPVS